MTCAIAGDHLRLIVQEIAAPHIELDASGELGVGMQGRIPIALVGIRRL